MGHGLVLAWDPPSFVSDPYPYNARRSGSLCPRRSLLRWKYKPKSFKRTLPLYKMALKYKVDYITDVLSEQLEQDWPKNIWEWDAYESDHALYIKGGRSNYADMNPEPVAAIQFAREANLQSILPAAFYQLSTISMECDFDKQARLDPSLLSDYRCARWSELTKEDLFCLIAGRDSLATLLKKIQLWFVTLIPAEESKCREAWTLMPTLKSDDILRELQELCKPDKLPGALMCKSCRDKVNERGRKEREAIWKLLPQYFLLPEPR